ncbi:MAG TPA: protease inhibitor I42 family protein [Patescibacteria group bacterium]|nr:protease inhibitor I42 family protein [Patescibacteria group bacterium]
MNKNFKKIFLILSIFILVIFISACQKSALAPIAETNLNLSVAETGTVIDVSEKSGETFNVVPGDVVYLKLVGQSKSGKQWTVVSPTQGDYLSLKEQKVTGLDDKEILAGKTNFEWWLKIENKGEFDLQFDYAKPGKKAEQTFKIKVISQ